MTEVVRSWDLCSHPEHHRRRRTAYTHNDEILVQAVDRKDRPSPWTQSALPLPSRVGAGSLRILAVVPHEWSTDLVVSFLDDDSDPHIQEWRVSPVRVLRIRDLVPDVVGEVFRVECGGPGEGSSNHRSLSLLTRDETHVCTHKIDVSSLTGCTRTGSVYKRRAYALFVSYKSTQEPFAKQVVERLVSKDVDLWFAPLHDKGKFARDMPELVAHARHVLLLLSDGSSDEWERVIEDPLEPPYKQAHEIMQAIRNRESKNLIVCCADESSEKDESAVRPEVREDDRHVYTRAEATRRHGVDAGGDGYARIIADYVLGQMRKETLR